MVGIFFKDRIMVQELGQILDLLREIKKANSSNEETLKRLLTSMNGKVDSIKKDALSPDLIKSYLKDITKSFDGKFQTTSKKFAEIEKSLKAIIKGQNDHASNKDLKEFSDNFSKNLNNFYSESGEQKSMISSIEAKLEKLNSNVADKDMVLDTMSKLQGDFDNLNQLYSDSVETLSSDLKNVLSKLQAMEKTSKNSEIQAQVAEMHKSVGDIVEVIKSMAKRETKLEEILKNTASAESLKLTQVAVDSIITRTGEISDKLEELYDANASKDQFSELSGKVDELSESTGDVKQALVGITKNIDSLSDVSALESSLQNVYNKIKEIHEAVADKRVKGNIKDIDGKINNFTSELSTTKNIIMDLKDVVSNKLLTSINEISFAKESYDIKKDISKMLVMLPQKDDVDRLLENDELNNEALRTLSKKIDDVAYMIDTLPKHADIDDLSDKQTAFAENLLSVATKEDVENVSNKADVLEEMIDKINFDQEFENLYNRASSIEKWLEDSKVKENAQAIVEKVEEKADKEDVLNVLKTTEDIVSSIEELSKNVDIKKVNRTVSEVYQLIEELKNDFVNTTESHNASVVAGLSGLQKSVENVLQGEEFDNFVEDLKAFVDKIGEDTNSTSNGLNEVQNYQKTILDRLSEIDTSPLQEVITKQFSNIDEKITNLSEYVKSMKRVEPEFVRDNIAEIKEILSNKKSNISEIEDLRKDTVSTVESYLNEIKVLFDTSKPTKSVEVNKQISGIEDIINTYHSENENNLTNIIKKLDDLKTVVDTGLKNRKNDMLAAAKEIVASSDSLSELASGFEQASNVSNNSALPEFVSDNLRQISDDIKQLSLSVESGLQSGFTYSAELLEEKISALMKFMNSAKDSNSSSDLMNEKFDNADVKLADIQQSLHSINSDLINHSNSQSEMLLKEILPIRDMMQLVSNSVNKSRDEELKSAFETLHGDIAAELEELTKYSKSSFAKLEGEYEKVCDALSSTEYNIRDYFLNDIDSVIRKLDDLRQDLSEMGQGDNLPKPVDMEEFRKFTENLENFKNEQKSVIEQAVQDVKETISSQLNDQQKELKSILAVAANNEEIIAAIEDLKTVFVSKIEDFENREDSIFDNLDENYEYPQDLNGDLIAGLKKDFEKCSKLIGNLSDNNPELSKVLSAIKGKMNSISVSHIKEVDAEDSDKTLVGTDNFDFIKAFDLLKEDIKKLNDNFKKEFPKGISENAASALNENSVDSDLLNSLNTKVDALMQVIQPQNWLNDIKFYTEENGFDELLEEINDKLDTLISSDSKDIASEVKKAINEIKLEDLDSESEAKIQQMLTLIDSKIDALASVNDSSVLDEVKNVIGNISLPKDNEASNLLSTISNKIDVLALSDNISEFEDIKDSLASIDERLSKKDSPVDVEGIKKQLTSLESKVDVIAQTDNSDDFDQIRAALDNIDSKVDVLALSDTSADLDDIKYTLADFEDRISTFSKLSDSDAMIKSMLEALTDKMEALTSQSGSELKQTNLNDIKDLIVSQSSYIENLEKNDKTEALKKCLDELAVDINNIASLDNTAAVQETIKEMKDSIMSAVVTVFNQVSFVEESEEIKDFVEEKTDEINKSLALVTNQLKQITNSNDEPEYTYSMQDIESDLAKMRLALNELQTNDNEENAQRLNSILDNISKIGDSVDNLRSSLTKDESVDIQARFDSINSDIHFLSDLTNSLIEKSGKSYSSLEGYTKALTGKLSGKFDNVTRLLQKSNESDKVMRQALIYMGEWIDSASASMNKICENSSQIHEVKSSIAELKRSMPAQADLLMSISDKFEQQQQRIDRLEMALDRIISSLDDIDDSKVARKVEKIDKQLAKLSTSVEKLASYVD